MKGPPTLEEPGWERLLYLDRVQERTPEIAEEIVGSLVERFSARRGALVLTATEGGPRVVAARERGGRPVDPDSIHPPAQALDSLAAAEGAVFTLRAGKAMAIPLRAVVREGDREDRGRRRFGFARIERTLGYVYLEGEEMNGADAGEEVRVASTLGSLLLATAAPSGEAAARAPGLRSPLLLQATLAEEIALAAETETPFTLALAELDDFDGWLGNVGPDEARCLVEQTVGEVRRHLRRFDAVLRCGGHAFAILFPATDPGGGQVVAGKVRAVAATVEGGPMLSVGCASFPADAGTPAEVLRRAEQALEKAREEGGDRAVSWSQDLEGISVTRGQAVCVGGPADLDRLLYTVDGLDWLSNGPSMERVTDAVLRSVALASGATRGTFLQPGERGMRQVAVVGEGWEPPAGLVRRAVASGGRVEASEDADGLPTVLAWGVPGSAGTAGVLALQKDGGGFALGAVRTAEALVRLARPVLRDRQAGEEIPEEVQASPFTGLVGASPAMQEVHALMRKVLTSRVTVLLVGETGTGKELVARAIHRHSDRADGPFVTVDCGALPATLADSELFGHKKGAFTDATADRQGLVERADGGTLLLDEVSSMARDLQPRLLRFLQEGEIRSVGETEYRKVDVRVIAASNHDLRKEVEEQQLRLDLYHRLCGVQIRVPPLRERKEDIPALAAHFLRRFAAEESKPAKRLGADALERLIAHDWPGNVRELENAVRAGCLVAEEDTVCAEDLPEPLRSAGMARPWPIPRTNDEYKTAKESAVAEITRQFLSTALAEAAGNVSSAARRTGLQRTYFHRLMKENGVDPRDFKPD